MGFCNVDVMWAEIVLFLSLSILLYSCKSRRLNSRKAIIGMPVSEKNVSKDSRVYLRFPPMIWFLTFSGV